MLLTLESRWLIYALGSGWGHLNRAIALARAAPYPVEVLVNSHYSHTVQAKLTEQQITLQRLPSQITSPIEAQGYVKAWLTEQYFSHLVVDTFPRGLVGELIDILPQLNMSKTLVHRDLAPDYIAAKNLIPFIQEHYDQVLIPGESQAPLAHLQQVQQTGPWLMREPAELLEIRDALQQDLQLPNHQPVIIVCATGTDEELAIFGKLHRQLREHYPTATVRCLAHSCPPDCPTEQWISHWPGLEVLQFADVVVGAAGYNLTYECAALGVPLVSLPMGRKYDRQAKRAAMHSLPVSSISDCITTVGGLLSPLFESPSLERSKRSHPQQAMENGVQEAISLIEALH